MKHTAKRFLGYMTNLRRLMRKQRLVVTSEKTVRNYTLENFQLYFEK